MTESWLRAVGLRPGDEIRFRREGETRWLEGRVLGRHPDGSIDLRDARARSRAIPIELIEVAERGRRGGRVWTPLTEVIARTEQLDLFDDR